MPQPKKKRPNPPTVGGVPWKEYQRRWAQQRKKKAALEGSKPRARVKEGHANVFVRLGPTAREEIIALAKQKQTTLSKICREAIEAWLRHGAKPPTTGEPAENLMSNSQIVLPKDSLAALKQHAATLGVSLGAICRRIIAEWLEEMATPKTPPTTTFAEWCED